ncbi:MAG: OsmC family protein [Bacteroidetes bacterium]|nr:OsmC family protein [Bacteroidota bacterium]
MNLLIEEIIMEINLRLDRNMRIIGTSELGFETVFDTHPSVGGEDTAPAPMEVFLQAMAACSFMDVVSIIRKKRKEVIGLDIKAEAVRATTHPKVITDVHLTFVLTSPDAEQGDLDRAVELSQKTYCGASAMFQRSGCKVTWETIIKRP